MADGDTSLVSEQGKQENNKKLPATGFHTNPERINRNGRPPKGHSITETIRAMMDEKPEIKKALGAKILKMALEDGDVTAIKLIWSYLDGMPTVKQELTGKDGGPLLPQPILGGNTSYVISGDNSNK